MTQETPPPPPAPVLRGSPERLTNFMEALQVGYVRAVAAASGVVIVPPPEIDEGVDLMLTHRSEAHTLDAARVEVQLKSTRTGALKDSEALTVQLTRKRYDYLRMSDPSVPKILVMMAIPEDQGDWVRADHGTLQVRRASYWVNLEGAQASAAERPTVSVPTAQIFDDVALCAIMQRVGQGGKP